MSERFTTPIGRFVQGDAFKAQDKDQAGQPRVIKSGPNAGQPNPQYFIGLAIPKTPGCQAWFQETHPFFQTVLRVGQTDFPGGQSARPDFAWKIRDGDSPLPNKAGRILNQIEGFAGHWIASFSSSYPPKCFARPDYAPHQQIQDPARIKRGDYIMVDGSVSGNGNMTGNPGVYLNLDLISWEAHGAAIVSGPDASAVFGGAAPTLPVGASVTPLAPPVPYAPTGTPMAHVPAAAPPIPSPAPLTPQATGASPSNAPPPYAGFMAPPPGAPPVPVATPGPVMLPAANGATREQMLTAGWTDALLVQHGMMPA